MQYLLLIDENYKQFKKLDEENKVQIDFVW